MARNYRKVTEMWHDGEVVTNNNEENVRQKTVNKERIRLHAEAPYSGVEVQSTDAINEGSGV